MTKAKRQRVPTLIYVIHMGTCAHVQTARTCRNVNNANWGHCFTLKQWKTRSQQLCHQQRLLITKDTADTEGQPSPVHLFLFTNH